MPPLHRPHTAHWPHCARAGLPDEDSKLVLTFKGSAVRDLVQPGEGADVVCKCGKDLQQFKIAGGLAPHHARNRSRSGVCSNLRPTRRPAAPVPAGQRRSPEPNKQLAAEGPAHPKEPSPLPRLASDASTMADPLVSQPSNDNVPSDPAPLRPAPEDSRKRPADAPSDDILHTDRRPRTCAPGSNVTPPTLSRPQPRRVPSPGATAEAIARQAALAAANQAAAAAPTHTAGKRVPNPGATQAAISRIASMKAMAAAGMPKPPIAPGAAGPGRRVPAPGETQAAMARLAALTANGSASHAASGLAERTPVWAKMPSYPWWPAQVQRPSPDQQRIKHGAGDIFIVFFGECWSGGRS